MPAKLAARFTNEEPPASIWKASFGPMARSARIVA